MALKYDFVETRQTLGVKQELLELLELLFGLYFQQKLAGAQCDSRAGCELYSTFSPHILCRRLSPHDADGVQFKIAKCFQQQ